MNPMWGLEPSEESVALCAEDGIYGVDIPKNVWHKLESLEPGSVIFECKEGPFVPGIIGEQDGSTSTLRI